MQTVSKAITDQQLSLNRRCIDIDLQQPGFATVAEVAAYCVAPANAADPCCAAARTAGNIPSIPVTNTTTTVIATATTAASLSTTASAPTATSAPAPPAEDTITVIKKPQYLGLIIGGGVLLLILFVVVVFYSMRRAVNKRLNNSEAGVAGGAAVAGGAGAGADQTVETMQVIYDYSPNLFDELELHAGDNVIVKCKFDDGWGFGFNMTTKAEGSFPLACVAPLTVANEDIQGWRNSMRDSVSQFNPRASSIYGAPALPPK
eukprot:jgi/Hompol1/2014/HPOL_001211-RA